MARLRLRKLLRGESGRAVQALVDLTESPISVLDSRAKVLLGDPPAPGAERLQIAVEGEVVGEVHGTGEVAQALATLLTHLCARELEKVQLANETLGRYKELTLLYEMSDRMSRMLDAGEVARSVVQEAQRAVGGTEATLFVHDQRIDALVPLASSDPERNLPLQARSGVEGRVLRSGQAEFVEEVDSAMRDTLDSEVTSVICAPMRSGERVAGVLRVTHNRPGAWNSGDLKLVTSLAAQAAAALQGAELHQNRLREVALKHHLQRYVSPHLLDALLSGTDAQAPTTLALVFCDLTTATSSSEGEDVVTAIEGQLTRAVNVLLDHGAVVDIPQGTMILAALHEPEAASVADRAVRAALALVGVLAGQGSETDVPGVGITSTTLHGEERDGFGEALNAAALLQAASGGRILLDYDVATALDGRHNPTEVDGVDLPGARTKVFEVRS